MFALLQTTKVCASTMQQQLIEKFLEVIDGDRHSSRILQSSGPTKIYVSALGQGDNLLTSSFLKHEMFTWYFSKKI